MDLALNNLQRLIYHKTQQTKPKIMWLIFSCVSISLYPPVHFQICHWKSSSLLQKVMVIAHLPGTYHSEFSPQLSFFLRLSVPLSNFFMASSMNFIISTDILYILRQSIIQLCGTISFTFLLLTHTEHPVRIEEWSLLLSLFYSLRGFHISS